MEGYRDGVMEAKGEDQRRDGPNRGKITLLFDMFCGHQRVSQEHRHMPSSLCERSVVKLGDWMVHSAYGSKRAALQWYS